MAPPPCIPVCSAAPAFNLFTVVEQPSCRAFEIDPNAFGVINQAENKVETERKEEITGLTKDFEEKTFYPVDGNLERLPKGVRSVLEESGDKAEDYQFSYEMMTVAGAAMPVVSLRKIGETSLLPKPGGKAVDSFTPPSSGPKAPSRGSGVATVVGGVMVVMLTDKLVERGLDFFHAPQSLKGPLQLLAPMAVNDLGYAAGVVETPLMSKAGGRSMLALTGVNWGYSHLLDAAGLKMGTDANTYGSFGLTGGTYVFARSLARKSPQFASSVFYGTGIKLAPEASILARTELSLGSRAGTIGFKGAGILAAVSLVDTASEWTIGIADEIHSKDPAQKIRIAARNEILQESCSHPYENFLVDVGCLTMGGIGKAAVLLDGDLEDDMNTFSDEKAKGWIKGSDEFANWMEAALPELVIASMRDELTEDEWDEAVTVFSKTVPGWPVMNEEEQGKILEKEKGRIIADFQVRKFWPNLDTTLSDFYTKEEKDIVSSNYNQIDALTGYASPKGQDLVNQINVSGRILNQGNLARYLTPLLQQRLANTEGLFAQKMVKLGLARFEEGKLVPLKVDSEKLNGDQSWFVNGDGLHSSEGMQLQAEIKKLRAALKIVKPPQT